jgi:hypothetical protein
MEGEKAWDVTGEMLDQRVNTTSANPNQDSNIFATFGAC